MSSVPSVFPILHNARLYTDQRIQSRGGMSKITSTPFDQLLVHTMRRLNDKTTNTFDRVVGAGTKLYLASNPTAIDTGYSGNPLSMLPFRPEQSPRPWMYIGDSNKMRKVLVDGTNYQVGIAPPLGAPSVAFAGPAIQLIDDFEAIGSWTVGGTAGALSVITRATSGILVTLFDKPPVATVGTGWASIVLAIISSSAAFASLAAGDRITISQAGGGNSEIATIQEAIAPAWAPGLYVSPGNPGVTIAAIAYDSGTTGPCTITLNIPPTAVRANLGYTPQMSDPSSGSTGSKSFRQGTTNPVGLRINSCLALDYGTGNVEFIRVLSLSSNQGNTISFRCVTVNTQTVGAPVVPTASVRVYLGQTYTIVGNFPSPAMSLIDKALQSTIGAGVGTISEVAFLNLGIVAGQNVSIQEDDWIHLAFLIDNAANLVEVRLIFDVDTATTDFQHTYFFKSFGPNDIQQALVGNATMQQARSTAYSSTVVNADLGALPTVKRAGAALVLPPELANNPSRALLHAGSNIPRLFKSDPIGQGRWMNFRCLVSDLTKVGTDATANLANTGGCRIQITVSSQAVCAVDSLWIGGCYGPDVGTTGAPYLYRYRGRSSMTGAKSLAGPATRSGIEPHRQQIEVDMVQHPDPQVDQLDVFRWGGTLPQWTYVGSIANSASPAYFDVFSDTDIANAPLLDTDVFQPFPTIDTPKAGTCNVSGTTVLWVSGPKFNTNWYPGSEIVINGIVYNLYAQPSSQTQMEIVQNGGTQAGVPFQINQATILGVPLPAFWGPYQQGTGLFCFACGDNFQPGVLFLTNGNDPDSASDVLQIEITTPTEPLMNGCMYNGNSYVWSSERMFSLYPSFGSGIVIEAGTVLPAEGTNLFVPIEVPSGKGLFCRFCLAVGLRVYFRARDGIYASAGGAPENITMAELSLLFPHDNVPGVPVTVGTFTIYPPDDTLPNLQKLSYYNSFLYFDYQDTQGNKTTLVYSEVTGAWTKDDYTPTVASHYGEEGQGVNDMLLGGSDGNIYQVAGTVDGNAAPFAFEARMPQMSELVGGYQHTRDAFLGLMDNAGSNLVINVDGADTLVALPSVSGAYKRFYQVLPALKGRLLAFGLLGTSPFQGIFQRDCEFRVKTWADPSYSKINPFGSMSRAAAPKVT